MILGVFSNTHGLSHPIFQGESAEYFPLFGASFTVIEDCREFGSNFVKTQCKSTQLKATLKQLPLELDTVVKCTPPHPTQPQTFKPLLDQLESWNLAQTLTRPTW